MFTKKPFRTISMVLVGHVLEVYDLVIYGYLSPYLAEFFFPSGHETANLMKVFGILFASYGFRPLGAWYFGRMTDRKGRKVSLIASLVVLTLATLTMAVLPDFRHIGVYASIGLVLCKCMQGFAFGGEYTGAIVYLLEQAPEKKRIYWSSFVVLGTHLGWFFAALLCYLVMQVWGAAAFHDGLWRVMFLIGALGALVGSYWRHNLEESRVFLALKKVKDKDCDSPSWGLVLRLVGLCAAYLVFSYLTAVYEPSFLFETRNFQLNQVLPYTMLGHLVMMLAILWLGRRADCMNVSHILAWSILAGVICVGPYFWAMAYASWGGLIFFKLLFLLGCLGLNFIPIYIASILPVKRRGFISAITYHTSAAIFAGGTPWVAMLLVANLHHPMAPAFWFVLAALLSGWSLYGVARR
jgi:MFS transporter, MHS family, proline/betaine transporter